LVNYETGAYLVKFARKTIENSFRGRDESPVENLSELYLKRGAFVTLRKYPNNELRGCIGFIKPIYPLIVAVKEAALSAAFNDPRFPPLREQELPHITIEVSILTEPELIKVKDRRSLPRLVRCGIDGLIIERGIFSGVLLPQVCTEFNWDSETFLSQTCVKAFLRPDCWLDPETKIHRFQAEIFEEKEPLGEIVKVK